MLRWQRAAGRRCGFETERRIAPRVWTTRFDLVRSRKRQRIGTAIAKAWAATSTKFFFAATIQKNCDKPAWLNDLTASRAISH